MATSNQLRARVDQTHAEAIEDIVETRDVERTEAERIILREGLASLGYVEKPINPGEMLLDYARKGGSLLGFVGLILIGYGLFGAATFRYIGFGLILVGFAGIAAAEFAPTARRLILGKNDESDREVIA